MEAPSGYITDEFCLERGEDTCSIGIFMLKTGHFTNNSHENCDYS